MIIKLVIYGLGIVTAGLRADPVEGFPIGTPAWAICCGDG
jgi:hypothetical protein